VSPGGDALPGDGVWVSFSVLEGCLELTQLDAGEVTALTSTTAATQLGRHRLQQRTCGFQKKVIFLEACLNFFTTQCRICGRKPMPNTSSIRPVVSMQ